MPDKEPIKTRTGRVLTDADVEASTEEAERGYDVNEFKTRRRGRPMLVVGPPRSCRYGWIRS